MTDRAMASEVRLVMRGPDGATVTRFVPTAVSTDDATVRRLVALGGREVITEYAPARRRPASYPAWLPFLPERPVVTTESGADGVSPGARWPCASSDEANEVVAAVEGECVAAGWDAAPTLQFPQAEAGTRILVCGTAARVLLVVEVAPRAVVQLLEILRTDLQEREV